MPNEVRSRGGQAAGRDIHNDDHHTVITSHTHGGLFSATGHVVNVHLNYSGSHALPEMSSLRRKLNQMAAAELPIDDGHQDLRTEIALYEEFHRLTGMRCSKKERAHLTKLILLGECRKETVAHAWNAGNLKLKGERLVTDVGIIDWMPPGIALAGGIGFLLLLLLQMFVPNKTWEHAQLAIVALLFGTVLGGGGAYQARPMLAASRIKPLLTKLYGDKSRVKTEEGGL